MGIGKRRPANKVVSAPNPRKNKKPRPWRPKKDTFDRAKRVKQADIR